MLAMLKDLCYFLLRLPLTLHALTLASAITLFGLLGWFGASTAQEEIQRLTKETPAGGSIVALVIEPQTPTTLYAGTGGGVLKSTDSGRHWTVMNNGLTDRNVEALAIDPQYAQTLYAATYGGIFKSITGGESWNSANTGLPANTHPYVLVIDPTHPTTLYTGSEDGRRQCVGLSIQR